MDKLKTLEGNEAFFKNLRIRLAHDPEDIIWKNIGLQSSKKTIAKIAIYFIFCVLIFIVIFALKYISTYSSLSAFFQKGTACLTFQFSFSSQRISCTWLFLNIPIFLLPLIGSIFIEVILNSMKRNHISTYTNLKFVLDTLFQFSY